MYDLVEAMDPWLSNYNEEIRHSWEGSNISKWKSLLALNVVNTKITNSGLEILLAPLSHGTMDSLPVIMKCVVM